MKKLVNSITMAYDEDVSKRDKEIMIKNNATLLNYIGM